MQLCLGGYLLIAIGMTHAMPVGSCHITYRIETPKFTVHSTASLLALHVMEDIACSQMSYRTCPRLCSYAFSFLQDK